MATPINIPQRQQSNGLSPLLTAAGTIAGAVYGGPSGAALGASLGSTAGSLLSPKPTPEPQGVATDTAMQRRMNAQNTDAFEQLRQGALALHDPNVPPEVKAEYARPVLTAYVNAAKQKGINNPFEGFPEVG